MKKVINMSKTLLIITSVITAIGVGMYAIVYALINAAAYIGVFLVGAIGLGFGLFSLKVISDNLK